MALSRFLSCFRAGPSALGFSTTAPSEQTASLVMPRSTPMVGPSLSEGARSPVSMERLANHWPAVRLTVTSQIRSMNLRCSTIATGPILGTVAPFPSTLTVSGPLSARNPSWCFRRLKRENPTRRNLIPCFRFLPYSRQLEMAWPRSMMAYFAAFCDGSLPQGAIIPPTRFHPGRRRLSESPSSASRPARNSSTAHL